MTNKGQHTYFTKVPFQDLYLMCIFEKLSKDTRPSIWRYNILENRVSYNSFYVYKEGLNDIQWYPGYSNFVEDELLRGYGTQLSIVNFLWKVL